MIIAKKTGLHKFTKVMGAAFRPGTCRISINMDHFVGIKFDKHSKGCLFHIYANIKHAYFMEAT